MSAPSPFRIAYIGGGSRFVVTLLHGLAAQADALKALGRPIELALLDIRPERAEEMARYARITARETGLDLRPLVTERREEALEGAGWVLLSVSVGKELEPLKRRFLEPMGSPYGESGPGAIVEAVAAWPLLTSLAEQMKRRAPGATFSTLVNPTDIQAAAFQKAFDIPAIGTCVEVPGLRGWLSYYLEEPEEAIHLEHVGVNHVGWVSRWSVGGREGGPLFEERIPRRMERADWYPYPALFVRLYETLGYLRSSPYHHWPFRTDRDEAARRQEERWAQACLPPGLDRFQHRQQSLARALAEDRMIPDPDPTKVHPEATPYTYPNTRHTLGALAVGLAGGSAGPIPLQVRNGASNPYLPEDAWIEVPTRVESGKLLPQSVPALPNHVFGQTALLAEQRRLLSDWLAGRDPAGLAKGLLALPETAPANQLLSLARELPEVLGC